MILLSWRNYDIIYLFYYNVYNHFFIGFLMFIGLAFTNTSELKEDEKSSLQFLLMVMIIIIFGSIGMIFKVWGL